MIAHSISSIGSDLGGEMLVSVMLFWLGWLTGRTYTVVILVVTSSVIMVTSLTIFIAIYGLDLL